MRLRPKKKKLQSESQKIIQPQLQSRPFDIQTHRETPQNKTEAATFQEQTQQQEANFGNIALFAPDQSPPPTPIIQPKLKISLPHNRYEQEADSVAEEVVNQINYSSPTTTPIQRQSIPKISSYSEPQIQRKAAIVHHRKSAQNYARIYERSGNQFNSVDSVDNDTNLDLANEPELYRKEIYYQINSPEEYQGKWIKNSNIYYLHVADSDSEPANIKDRVYRQLLMLSQAWDDWKHSIQETESTALQKKLVREDLGVAKLKKIPKDQRTQYLERVIYYVRQAKKASPVIEQESFSKYKRLQAETQQLVLAAKESDEFDDDEKLILENAYDQIVELPEVANMAIQLREFIPVKTGAKEHLTQALQRRTALLTGNVSSAAVNFDFGLSIGLPIIKIEPTLTIGGKLWVAQDRKFRANTSVKFNVAFKIPSLDSDAFALAANVFGKDVDVYSNPEEWIEAKADQIARFYVKLKHLATQAMSENPELANQVAEEFGLASQNEDLASQPKARPNVKAYGGGASANANIPKVVSGGASLTYQKLKSRKPDGSGANYDGKVLQGRQIIFKKSFALPSFGVEVTTTWTKNHLNPLNDGNTIDIKLNGFPISAVGQPGGDFKGKVSAFMLKNDDPSIAFDAQLLAASDSGNYDAAGEGIASTVKTWAENLGKSQSGSAMPKFGFKRDAGIELRWQKPPKYPAYKLQYIKTFHAEQLSVSASIPTGSPGVNIKFGMKAKRYNSSNEMVNDIYYLMQMYGGLKAWGTNKEKWQAYKQGHQTDLQSIFGTIKANATAAQTNAELSEDQIIKTVLPGMDLAKAKLFLAQVQEDNSAAAITAMEEMFEATTAGKVEAQKAKWTPDGQQDDADSDIPENASLIPEDAAHAKDETNPNELITLLLDDPRTFEAYNNDLQMSGIVGGKWADHYEIKAVARGINKQIQLHQIDGTNVTSTSSYGAGNPALHLIIKDNYHYNALKADENGSIEIDAQKYSPVEIPRDGDCFYAAVSEVSDQRILQLRQLAHANMPGPDKKESIASALVSLSMGQARGVGVRLRRFYEGFFAT